MSESTLALDTDLEEGASRLSVPGVAAILAALLLSAAILYNALWRQASVQDAAAPANQAVSSTGDAQGSARVVVDVDQPAPTTVTLRYDPVVEAVQRELAASGIYNGPIDGVAGRRTQLSIIAYERSNGLEETGIATEALIDHIQLTRQFTEAAGGTTGSLPDRVSATDVKAVQLRLAELGYAPGVFDGELRQETQTAIRRFQRDRGLPETGQVSDELFAELNKRNPQPNRVKP